VGSLTEALEAARAGCDFVVAQGIEAGGHVRGTARLDVLLGDVAGALSIPVVAAGGIATPMRVRDLLAAGRIVSESGPPFFPVPRRMPIRLTSMRSSRRGRMTLSSLFGSTKAGLKHHTGSCGRRSRRRDGADAAIRGRRTRGTPPRPTWRSTRGAESRRSTRFAQLAKCSRIS
jgi:hypothetical protein